MKKIPTLFKRDFTQRSHPITEELNPACEWVARGEGVPTVKMDGTCCLIRDGKLYKRRELKGGDVPPPGFELAYRDEETGKSFGWVPVSETAPEDRWHREAHAASPWNPDGTYELVGPKVAGNPHRFVVHVLLSHDTDSRCIVGDAPPSDFHGIRDWLSSHNMEGVVWHHKDGRMAKIKRRDFGFPWPMTGEVS